MKMKADFVDITAQVTLTTSSPEYLYVVNAPPNGRPVFLSQFPDIEFRVVNVHVWSRWSDGEMLVTLDLRMADEV